MEKQIPKIIHYCWFGGNPLPALAHKCIASWKKFLPDYEVKEWNESNFNVYQAPYVAEAYRLKRYAHVSDYARFWILYHYGGIYFDTDVELIRPIDDLLERGSYMGFECQEGTQYDNPNGNMNPGLGFAVCKEHPFLRKMVEDSDFLAISVISKLEFLSYPDLTEDEKLAFYELLEDLTVFDLTASDDALLQEAVAMRIDGGLKLPDAVIAATALVNDCEVITNDAHFAHQKRVQARTYDL